MKIKLTVPRVCCCDGKVISQEAGCEIDVPDDEANRLIDANQAAPTETKSKPKRSKKATSK